ncbi:MAG: ATP-binding cassette domain-containing protein [Planctomycetota bacterium]|nr:ATP-binding cassette domain-containing protein [Planctomycetota bacterium]
MSAALEIKNLVKRYGDFTAVGDLSLSVPKGSIYGFLGPNGAGKTTTIRMILDIVKPTEGSISILGAGSAMDVRDRIGYLPEEKGLYKKMKAWAVIAYFARLKGVAGNVAKKRAFDLLDRYGLGQFANAKVETLSKGMGQKVQVLASIAHRPDFVILDEPFSGLDPSNQQVMEKVISDLNKEGATIIFSTHVMSHAERICDRILLIASAKKVFDGTIEQARELLPPRVRVSGDFSEQQLQALPSVNACHVDEDSMFALDIVNGCTPQQLMTDCFDANLSLDSFEYRQPDLHDVFLHLVGDEAKVATVR